MSKRTNPLKVALHKYNYNRLRQKGQGASWDLKFPEWYAWWLSHGVDKNLPSGPMSKDSLCMVRRDETKPFSIDNIQALTHGYTDGQRKCYKKPTRPQTWVIKDPIEHPKYIPFLRARAQANFRGEAWDLTFEQFSQLWGDLWKLRGRASTDYCMTRDDLDGPWDMQNAVVIKRKDSLNRARSYSMANGTRYGRKK